MVVNTGDDETFFGLHVSPDLDTVTYTLANRVDARHGWGVAGDTYHCLTGLRRFYSQTWFRLGDADLATHIYRTEALRQGRPLSRITADIVRRHGLTVRILPMSDDPVRTMIDLAGVGPLPFQEYLVKRRGVGRVRAVTYKGVDSARPVRGLLTAVRDADVVIIPPSNPIVSIQPILALRGVRSALRRTQGRIAAVSPLVRGMPIKGPLDRLLAGLGHEVSAVGVARLYRDFVDVFVLDERDADLAPRVAALGMRPLITNTIMNTPARSRALAASVLQELRG